MTADPTLALSEAEFRLSRQFDLACVASDAADEDHDIMISNFIFAARAGKREENMEAADPIQLLFSGKPHNKLHTFLEAASELQVTLTADAKALIQAFFLSCRHKTHYRAGYLQTLMNLTYAHARLHLRTTGAVTDVLVGIMMLEESRVCLLFVPTIFVIDSVEVFNFSFINICYLFLQCVQQSFSKKSTALDFQHCHHERLFVDSVYEGHVRLFSPSLVVFVRFVSLVVCGTFLFFVVLLNSFVVLYVCISYLVYRMTQVALNPSTIMCFSSFDPTEEVISAPNIMKTTILRVSLVSVDGCYHIPVRNMIENASAIICTSCSDII